MSSNDRIKTLEGLGSAAKRIDSKHNVRVNPYRLVSSDGVLFTVSAKTLRHLHALWDMAESATSSGEVVLSDEDFEHSKSVRLLLDLLVHGVVGWRSYSLKYIGDVVDLTLKYDCRQGYEYCVAYIEQAFAHYWVWLRGCSRNCEIFVLAGQLDEPRIAKVVVKSIAQQQSRSLGNSPDHHSWNACDVALVPPVYMWALSQALYPNPCTRPLPVSYPSPEAAADRFVALLTSFQGDRSCPKQTRSAARRAQKPWRHVPAK